MQYNNDDTIPNTNSSPNAGISNQSESASTVIIPPSKAVFNICQQPQQQSPAALESQPCQAAVPDVPVPEAPVTATDKENEPAQKSNNNEKKAYEEPSAQKIIRNSSVNGSALIKYGSSKINAGNKSSNKRIDAFSKKYSASVQISRSALDAIIDKIGSKRPENGGMLIGPVVGDNITHFVFDEDAAVSSITYSPSFEELSVVCDIAAENGYTLKGFCHSHPCGYSQPSMGDMEYVRKFFSENEKLEKFYMPILTGAPIGEYELKRAVKNDDYSKFINFYVVFRENQYQSYKVNISIEEDRIGSYNKYKPIFPSVILPKSIARIRTSIIEGFIGHRGVSVTKKALKIGEAYVGCIIAAGAGFDISILMPTEFPILPPHVIVGEDDGAEYQCPIDNWDIEKNELPEKTLAKIIIGICEGGVKKSLSLKP